MKKLALMVRTFLTFIAALAMFVSCAREEYYEQGNDGTKEEKTVLLSLKVPGNAAPNTRSLGSSQEDEVDNLKVLIINPSTKNVYKVENPTNRTGSTFEVRLPVGTYDLVVLANANDIITAAYGSGGITKGTPKEDVIAKLTMTRNAGDAVVGDREGDKWNSDSSDPDKGYLMPMWGQISNKVIDDTQAQNIGTVNLYRMVAKIDVMIPREDAAGNDIITKADFALQQVTYHNYNTVGAVIPGQTSDYGEWEIAGGGKAKKPSLPGALKPITGHDKYQLFTSFEDKTPGVNEPNTGGLNTELSGVIYTFEADKGTNHQNRACVIISGSFKGGTITYYRADLIKAGTSEYFDLLRNHRYTIYIKKISGPGYDTIEEAYKSAPMNMEINIIEWDDNNYSEGVWNQNYEIRFSSVTAHFTQFGMPAIQTIKIRTNVEELRFENFTNISTGTNDGL